MLAMRAFSLFRDCAGFPRRVSGRLAAVIARAEGVEKPRARAKERSARKEDPAGLTIRAWEQSMARASRTVLRWRRDEIDESRLHE
jgi:hypothetical protein